MVSVDKQFEKETDAHLLVIGKVATGWSRIEHDLAVTIWRLAGLTNEVGACLTAQIPNSARLLDALISLARLKGIDESMISKMIKFAERTYPLQERRNRVVHDVWTFDPPFVSSRWSVQAKRKLSLEPVEVPTAELEELVAAILNHGTALGNITRSIYAHLASSPQ
jgi:hypothetical protein